jgi:predicted DNA-binding ribbon-helix-helix protein
LKEGKRKRKRGGPQRRPRRRETYYQRWRRQHPGVSLYLERKEYERLKEIAASSGLTVKDFILSLIEGFERYYNE